MAPSLSLAFLLLFVSSVLSPSHADPAAGAMSVELLHADSFNTSLTVPERVRAAFRRSAARAGHLAASLRTRVSLQSVGGHGGVSISTKLVPATNEYLMAFSLGTPPVTVLGAPDTGSDLVWTKCAPCRTCAGGDYDPVRSPTYRHLRCDSRPCSALGQTALVVCGGSQRTCLYDVAYADGSTATGVLSRDTLTFPSIHGRRRHRSSPRREVSFPKVLFGCTNEMGGLVDVGIVGLGRGPLSLISQLGAAIEWRFSHCLVPIALNATGAGRFRLGRAATVAGGDDLVVVPILPDVGGSTFYRLFLQDVAVGGERLAAELEVVIDSGSAMSLLPAELVARVEEALSSRIRLQRVKDPEEQFGFCYQTRSWSDVEEFPEVVFGFDGGELVLKPVNTFVPSESGVVCLSIVPTPQPGLAIFGYFAQQNYHVGYDLVKNTVSFAPADCAKL